MFIGQFFRSGKRIGFSCFRSLAQNKILVGTKDSEIVEIIEKTAATQVCDGCHTHHCVHVLRLLACLPVCVVWSLVSLHTCLFHICSSVCLSVCSFPASCLFVVLPTAQCDCPVCFRLNTLLFPPFPEPGTRPRRGRDLGSSVSPREGDHRDGE